ncbi:hypothetical protein E2C01_057964 [Portunus trituberculatus]|uniref:Uncharacterized protein n=1 Tax=Portunus trituberculatus TaxID=210409 RepID=A0A5B7H3E1_PORTR|nr:hypothetical protein [Portunus trituberculatus]
MPPLKTIQQLKTLSTSALTNFLASAFVKIVGGDPIVRRIVEVTEALTRPRRGKKHDVGFEMRVQRLHRALSHTLDTLLGSHVATLDLTPIQHQVLKWLSTCRLNNRDPKATGSLTTARLENMMLVVLGENVSRLASLSTLIWPHLVTGEAIKLIGGHCRSLKRLELACNCEATFAMNYVKEDPEFAKQEKALVSSLGALYDRAPGDFSGTKPGGCPKLKKLILPRLDDEDGGLAMHVTRALCHLRGLESITGAPMLVSLSQLRQERNAPSSLSLKHLSDIDTYNRRPVPDMQYLTQIVPKLTTIEVIMSENVTVAVLNAFPSATSLSLTLPDFYLSARRYKNLRHLDINLEFQVAWPLLQALSKGRIPLETLTIRHSTFQMGLDSCTNEISILAPVRLPSLTSFTLIRSSFIEFNALKTLMSGTPNLKNLTLTLTDDRNYMVDELNDSLVNVIAPFLPSLTSFTAECQYKTNLYNQPNCVLTMAAVEMLCDKCPLLKFIGHLDVWDVTEEEVKRLNDWVKRNNYDLHVV